MGVLDEASLCYGPPQGDWSLGDLVLAPTAMLWTAAERPTDGYPQPAPPPDGSRSVTYSLWRDSSALPSPAIECRLGPAIIVVDDCVIDKEFNAFIERRIREGMAEAEAVAAARADRSLDPLIPVAPVLPYHQLRYAGEAAVRQGQAVGYFPLPGGPDADEGFVDFTLTVPVSRQLLFGPAAALSDAARNILRWKLAQFYALRNLSVDAEISAAVGKTITAAHAVSDNKQRLVVDLELDHGASRLRLRQEPRRTDQPDARLRGHS